MELGMIGLGRMGASMTERLLQGGHRVVVYDRNLEPVEQLARKEAVVSESLCMRCRWRESGPATPSLWPCIA